MELKIGMSRACRPETPMVSSRPFERVGQFVVHVCWLVVVAMKDYANTFYAQKRNDDLQAA